MAEIVPAVLVHNFEDLKAEIEFLEKHDINRVQIDIMDGKFVPNTTIGANEIKKIKTNLELEAHLMIENPLAQLEDFYRAGCKILTAHYETCQNKDILDKVIQSGKKLGAQVGVAINPETAIGVIKKFLDKVDLILVMSVHPGFGGQKFIPQSIDRIKLVRSLAPENLKIEVDGGINLENISKIKKAGADYLVIGSGIFKSKNPAETLARFRQAVK